MKSFNFRLLGSVLFWVLAPLLVGVWLTQYLAPRPAVGIVRLNGDIWAGSADFVQRQLDEARNDPAIKAVVFQIDSPGGEVVATQQLFSEVLSLRQEMPVVGLIGSMAGSGGFYLAMASNPIYAQPSSDIGNLGAWTFAPENLAVNDFVVASGPFKLAASNQTEVLDNVEAIKQEFLIAVRTQRGDRLSVADSELIKGLTYPGREARAMGLVDTLGSQAEAVETAAQMAGIAHYHSIDLADRVYEDLYGDSDSGLQRWVGAADSRTGERTLPPGVYLLHYQGHHLKGDRE